MREIKFRVWDKKSNRFLELHQEGYEWFPWVCLSCDGKVMFNDNQGACVLENQDDYIIQQCTGVTDGNGKEIYEGDIVSVKCYEDWRDYVGFDVTYLVKWCDFHKGFRGFTGEMLKMKTSYSGRAMPEPITILGNLMENPELIK